MIDISDLDEASVLAELYNRSQPLGLGFLHFTPEPMGREEAAKLLTERRKFDYLKGRVMKVEFFDGYLRGAEWYDQDNGEGACAAAIAKLRASLAATG